jgi:hypothetical protein
MMRGWFGTLVAGLLFPALASAQAPACQFHWQAGDVLIYRIEHITTASEVAGENKSESKTHLNLTKRWQVLEVDNAGVATLQLTMTSLRLETTSPSGSSLSFDSTMPDKSDPDLREQLARLVGTPLATLRMDAQGQLVEVKESKHGPASRFESELPFLCTLPGGALQTGKSWERAYKITLEPPQGTGDKFDAVQHYTCKSVDDATATLTLTTELKALPENALDRVPLLQLQPEGEIVFDLKAGRLRSANLHIEKELADYQGEGSNYKFQSTYTEEYVEK